MGQGLGTEAKFKNEQTIKNHVTGPARVAKVLFLPPGWRGKLKQTSETKHI